MDNPAFSGYACDLSEGGIGITPTKVFPPDTELVFDMYIGDEVIRVEGVVARVTPIFSGIASIMGVKFQGRTDHIKHIYMQRLINQHHFDKITETE
jgi:hypothetical protein